MSLSKQVASGTIWTGASVVGRQIISFASVAVVARYVPASAYGLMGMSASVTNFLYLFRDLGTASALIQRKEVDDTLLSSVFWLNVILGAVMTALAALAAWPAADFFREPGLVPVMQVLSLNFLASSLSMVHSALMNREMQFQKLAIVELIAAILGAACSVAMAVNEGGVWSLATGSIVAMSATTILAWIAQPFRPKFTLDLAAVRSIAAYSFNLLGFSTVNYVARNADSTLIGRYLGATLLGYYQMTGNIMLYPLQNVTQTIGRVMLPTLSRIQDDLARFREAYCRVTGVIALITFPMMCGLMALAEPFVLTLFGEKWRPVIPLLLVLCPVAMFQTVVSTVGYIYTAKGRTDWMFRVSIAFLPVTVLFVWIGISLAPSYGLVAVAACYGIGQLLLWGPAFAVPFRLIGLRLPSFVAGFTGIFLCAAAMGVAVYGGTRGLQRLGVTKPAILLIVGVAFGTAVYLLLLRIFRLKVIRHLHDMLRATGRERIARYLAPFAAPVFHENLTANEYSAN